MAFLLEEEKPQVDEDIEVKRMRRLEHLRAIRASNPISEDGSGWVTLSPKPSNLNDSNSDLSPPRKQTARDNTTTDELKHSREDNDLSPPRQQRMRHHTPWPEPDNPSSYMSPAHNRRARNDTPSPGRDRKPGKEDMDLSPPRQRGKLHHTPSPEPYKGPVRSSDLSPPRNRRVRNNTPSPPRQRRRHHYTPSPEPECSPRRDNDISPPRRPRRDSPYNGDLRASPVSDLSPPRKSRNDGEEYEYI